MMDVMGGMSLLMDTESGFSPDMLPPMTFTAKIQDPKVHASCLLYLSLKSEAASIYCAI